MANTSAYLTPKPIAGKIIFPLSRFLPPVPPGVASTWLAQNLPPGSWVLDPFGASPDLAIEIAQAGYRLLVAGNNPIFRFMLETGSSPPRVDELQSVLSILAASKKGDERLEPHLLNLYATLCDECGEKIHVEAFLWERGVQAPFAKIYHCESCQANGQFPVSEADVSSAVRFAPDARLSSLFRAQALENVASIHDPDREYVERALQVYPSRAVYALFTILNKITQLSLNQYQQNLLNILLLHVFDSGNALWPHPGKKTRPKQLTVPSPFRENNIWFALEQAVNHYSPTYSATSISYYPNEPPETGGICLYQGRIRELSEQGIHLESKPQALLTAVPRPNQAYWSLSALWAGWLWGPTGAGAFRSMLRRQRYGWNWHTAALLSALKTAALLLDTNAPAFAVIPENEPGLLASVTLAAHHAGLSLHTITQRSKEQTAQVTWRPAAEPYQPPLLIQERPDQSVAKTVETLLATRSMPSEYAWIHAALLFGLGQLNLFPGPTDDPATAYTNLGKLTDRVLGDETRFQRYGKSDKSTETGQWWLKNPGKNPPPLSDQVERFVIQYLIENIKTTFEDLDQATCSAFPGLLTPSSNLIFACLESYAQREEDQHIWTLKEQDYSAIRRQDLNDIQADLINLGTIAGFRTETGTPNSLTWWDTNGICQASFHLQASAKIELALQAGHNPVGRRTFIVVPGGRANLLLFKLQQDPRLSILTNQQSIRFVKFRLVRRLAQATTFATEHLDDQFNLDPLTYTSPQMQLI